MEGSASSSPPVTARSDASEPPTQAEDRDLTTVADPVRSGTDAAANRSPLVTPPVISGYTLRHPIGAGGMGVVWKATQLGTQRDVAVKVMSAAIVGSGRARTRFEREVELAASLEHPNIARVYESGLSEGVYYYAMELVDGEPLNAFARCNALARRPLVRLMATVCQAVQYAHRRGIIHRDIKPSNVLVTKDGTPKLLDFGLARLVRPADAPGGEAETISGEVIGSPGFMSPEQARGEPDKVDTRTDVYSLGATLYLLLTGALPHDTGGPLLDVLRRVAEEPARRPRAVCPDLDVELDAILAKALEPQPDARYASAGELAADLERYLAGRPVAARPQTPAYLLRKWVLRHRWPVAGAAAALVAVVLGVGVYVLSMRRAYGEVRKAYSLSVDMLAGDVFQLQDGTGKGEAQLAARRRVMEKAIEDANRISRAAGSDAAVARTSAQAYAEMGQILEDAGEAEQAEMSYRRATGPLERLALAGPSKAKAALDLTVLQLRLTRLYLARGEAVAARRHFNDAERWLAMLETEAGYAGHAPERLAYERWGLTMARADLLLAEGDAASASQAAATALGLADAARRDANPLFDDGSRLASLAKVADCNVRSFEADGKDPARLQRALEVLDEAARVAEARIGSVSPPQPQALVDLGVIESARGSVHLRAGGAAEADAKLRRAVGYFDRALAADPARADWRRELLRALEASAAVAERQSREGDVERFRHRAAELRGPGHAGADGAAARNTAAPASVPASAQDRR